MPKPRKPDSRRPSKKKLQEMERKKKREIEFQKFREEQARYTYPAKRSEAEIEACKQRVKDGKLCYCKEKCGCRGCQAKKKASGRELCSLEALKHEGGCEFGCNECSECNPCY